MMQLFSEGKRFGYLQARDHGATNVQMLDTTYCLDNDFKQYYG